VTLAVAALAACSSGGGSTSTATTTATTASSGIPTVQQAAAAIGATDLGAPYTPKEFATQYADAMWHGHKITIATFAASQLEADWVNLAGMARPVIARGNLYAAIELPQQK
jgi:hypothetical protein